MVRTISIHLILVFLATTLIGSLSAQESSRLQPDNPIIGEGFGYAMASNDSQVVITTRFSKRAYLFQLTSEGWNQVGTLVSSLAHQGPDALKGFGRQVLMTPERMAISIAQGTVNGQKKAGTVELFELKNGAWQASGQLSAPTPTAGAWFGDAMSMAGSSMLIGAPRYEYETGQVWVADLNTGEMVALADPEGKPTYRFGEAVLMMDDLALVGAPGHAVRRQTPGAMHLYQRQADGSWLHIRSIVGEGNVQNLGQAFACVGNTLAVGIYDGVQLYEIDREAGTWNLKATISNPDAGAAMRFAGQIALSPDGTHMLIGASGVAYLYALDGENWTLIQRYASDATEFGSMNVIENGYFLLNSPFEGEDYINGAVYFYNMPSGNTSLIE